VTVSETFTAVSNMPVTHEEPACAGPKRISFAPTPPMSSYLFVLAAGERERTTGDADGVEIGVVTTIGKRERYALDSAIDATARRDRHTLSPGGMHIMLLSLTQPLREGQSFR
jgi:aminopeptidase N